MFAAKWLKTIRLCVTRFLCGTPLKVCDLRIGLTKQGLPKVLGPMIPLIKGKNTTDLRLILTLLNVSRLILGTGKMDITSITSPPTYNQEELDKLTTDLVEKSTWWLDKLTINPNWEHVHSTTKNGPNGQALATSFKDLAALPDDLRNDIYVLGGDTLKDYMELLLPAAKGFHPDTSTFKIRKLGVIRDKEGKNRTIAIFDYWSQSALRGIHDSLFECFRSLKTDLTFNQDATSVFQPKHPDTVYYSYDLSAATDRFPVSLQEAVLARLIGPEKASSWRRIMSQPFTTREGNSVAYAVGQPMGGYSSWAVFALCHHLVVQYASTLCGNKGFFKGYRLLGDDIVIFDNAVASKYLNIMTTLGVQISPTKSHVSKDMYEMAKRWFINGIEISPFPLNAILENQNNPHGLGLDLYNAMKKGWVTNVCQGYPGVEAITSLLKALGWGRRSISLRANFVLRCGLLYHALNNEDRKEGIMSMRLLASTYAQTSLVADPRTWIEGFMKSVYDVQLEALQRGIAVGFERLAQGHHAALRELPKLYQVCKPPTNPTLVMLAIPYLKVIGLATHELQRTMDRLQDEDRPWINIEILQCGNQITFPDPERISSIRTAKIANGRAGGTLHKLFRAYELLLLPEKSE